MYKEALRPAWTEIDLANFDYNIKNIIRKVGPAAEIIGVIKADAYGHGMLKAAEVLRINGVRSFAVATLREAVELRHSGADENIIVFSLTPDMYVDTIVEYDLIPLVCSCENARAFSDAAVKAGTVINGLIAIDTGMGRIGYPVESDEDIADMVSDIKNIAALPGFRIRGLFSHMAAADESDKTFSERQEVKFRRIAQALSEQDIRLEVQTLANSASIMELPSVYFNAVRPGIILYGLYPSSEVNKNELSIRPVMSVKANIVQLKDVPTGFSVGYGRKFTAARPSKIATISLGYADGLSRTYSGKGRVIVNGVYAPLAGNICMDQCMIDVTDVPDVRIGDEVIIMGSDGRLSISAEEIAEKTGTINYEIVCAFGQRLPKIYISK